MCFNDGNQIFTRPSYRNNVAVPSLNCFPDSEGRATHPTQSEANVNSNGNANGQTKTCFNILASTKSCFNHRYFTMLQRNNWTARIEQFNLHLWSLGRQSKELEWSSSTPSGDLLQQASKLPWFSMAQAPKARAKWQTCRLVRIYDCCFTLCSFSKHDIFS